MDLSFVSGFDISGAAISTAIVTGSVLLAILALIGVIITLIGLPGILLVYACMWIYALVTGFDPIGIPTLVIGGIVVGLFFVVDNVTIAMGAKMAKASKWATLAAFVGGIVGLLFFGPLGALIGPLVCVLIVEYYTDPDLKKALRAGVGTFLGYIAGTLVRFILAAILFVWFIVEML